MFRTGLAASALITILVSTSSYAANNPLIGKWRLAKGECDTTQIVYTPKDYAGFEIPTAVYPGWRHVAVTYNVSATEVWLIPVQGGTPYATRVFVIDANHIKPDDMCSAIYERVG